MGEIRRFAIADACSVYGESLRTKPSVAASASIVRERKEMTGLITTPAAPPPNRFGVRTTCMGLFLSSGRFGLLPFFVRSGKAVFRPVACDQVRGARGRGQGTETLAKA